MSNTIRHHTLQTSAVISAGEQKGPLKYFQ